MAKEYKQNEIWVVELVEDDWYLHPTKNPLQIAAYKQHMEAGGCSRLVIFVTPDKFFSSIPELQRHKVHEYISPVRPGADFKIEAQFSVIVDRDVYEATEGKARGILVQRCRDALNRLARGVSGKYIMQACDGAGDCILIERGRV